MPLRILQVIPRLGWGSAERQVLAIARSCPPEIEMHVATGQVTEAIRQQLTEANATIHTLATSRLLGSVTLASWISLVRRLRPGIVHCWRLGQNWPIALATRWLAPKLVVDQRLPDGNRDWFTSQGERWAARWASARVSPVPLRPRSGWPAATATIADRLDPLFCTAPPTAQPMPVSVREELGLPTNAQILLSVGRLMHRKRIDELIWTADLLKVIREDTHLVILGDGPDRNRLLHFRDQVQIRDRVWWIGPRCDVARWMRQSQCLWSASDDEDSPLAICESQAVGLPVIASDIAAHRRVIEPGRTGLLVPLGDSAVRARLTVQILDDGPFARTIADEARTRRVHDTEEAIQGRSACAPDLPHYPALYQSLG